MSQSRQISTLWGKSDLRIKYLTRSLPKLSQETAESIVQHMLDGYHHCSEKNSAYNRVLAVENEKEIQDSLINGLIEDRDGMIKRRRINLSAAYKWLEVRSDRSYDWLLHRDFIKKKMVKESHFTGIRTEAYRRSLEAENNALNLFNIFLFQKGDLKIVRAQDIVNPRLPFLIGSSDGLVVSKISDQHILALVEVKSYPIEESKTLTEWMASKEGHYRGFDYSAATDRFTVNSKSKHYVQVQLQLAMTGLDYAYLVIYHSNFNATKNFLKQSDLLYYILVRRDPLYCEKMIVKLENIYKKKIYPKIKKYMY